MPQAWRWGTRSVPKFHSESTLRAAIHTQVSVVLGECTYLTICWAQSAQIHRGGPVKNFGKVSCRSQIERGTSHSSGTKEDPDFQRSHKLNWTPNHNRGWVEACARARWVVPLQPDPKFWYILRNVTRSARTGTQSLLLEWCGSFHPSTIVVWGPTELV